MTTGPATAACEDRQLRFWLQCLVLLCVVFVHITRGVGLDWLGPLYALTAAAPVLRRFADHWLYRTMWNASVLAIFATLVASAGSSGVRYLLEDGLILAAFCQVHLLNNLGARQKPDLLFFNSFLIALVTGFFCQDVVYCVVFVAYAHVLVVGMTMAAAWPDASAGVLRAAALRKGFLVLATTLVVFLFAPRDFDREGLLQHRLAPVTSRQVGFSEEVRLGRAGPTAATRRVVFQIRLRKGSAEQVPTHWRGATLWNYHAGAWSAVSRRQRFLYRALDEPWEAVGFGRWVRPGRRAEAVVEVSVRDPDTAHLFTPLWSSEVTLREGGEQNVVQPREDGTWLRLALDAQAETPLRYTVGLHAEGEGEGGGMPPLPRGHPLLSLGPGALPAVGRRLARRLARAAGPGASRRHLVEVIRAHLADRFRYLPPGDPGGAEDLEEFLSGRAGGHCEFFATALALMLRSRGVPCRLVVGFLATEWDGERRVLTVRSRDAHAWVEVLDEDGRWFPADPSPSAADTLRDQTGWTEILVAAARRLWSGLTGFDDDRRKRVLETLASLPGAVWSGVRSRPWAHGGALMALALLWVFRRRRRMAAARPILRLERAARRSGVPRRPHETPREALERARAAGVAAERLQALEQAIRDHERERYAEDALRAGRRRPKIPS